MGVIPSITGALRFKNVICTKRQHKEWIVGHTSKICVCTFHNKHNITNILANPLQLWTGWSKRVNCIKNMATRFIAEKPYCSFPALWLLCNLWWGLFCVQYICCAHVHGYNTTYIRIQHNMHAHVFQYNMYTHTTQHVCTCVQCNIYMDVKQHVCTRVQYNMYRHTTQHACTCVQYNMYTHTIQHACTRAQYNMYTHTIQDACTCVQYNIYMHAT